jgi:class 3 adenylate cyclase
MNAFYQVALKSFSKFPADITKFAGDGILSIWRTTPQERHIAVQSVINGIVKINKQWKVVRTNPHFTHGAPDLIGTSMAFGQASRMKVQVGIDFIGRPINLAARLCGKAPGDKLIIDRSVPDLPENLELHDFEVDIKSFGNYSVHIMDCLQA